MTFYTSIQSVAIVAHYVIRDAPHMDDIFGILFSIACSCRSNPILRIDLDGKLHILESGVRAFIVWLGGHVDISWLERNLYTPFSISLVMQVVRN